MDSNRIRILTIFLFMFILSSLLLPLSIRASTRGIAVIDDLSHQSGKLGAYRALIIGINDYKDPKIPDLETAANDARAVAELLRERYGFQVELLLNRNATKESIYRALRKLASSAKLDDSVLIYYAGHGDFDRTYDDGWWIPADAKGGNPVTYLDNVQVQKAMRSMKARHALLISDSCYSGTLFGQARAMPQVIDDKYYLNLYNEKSRWGLTSGNKTPVSDQGSASHSVFAYQLLKELRKNDKPYISTQELYTRIAPVISNNSEQTPLCRPMQNTGDQGGEFVFVASRDADKAAKILAREVEHQRMAQEQEQLNKLAEERKMLKIELKQLEAEKQLLEEKKRLEAERIKLEKEKQVLEKRKHVESKDQKVRGETIMLASIPSSKPMTKNDIKNMLYRFGFYEIEMNPEGSFDNDFIDNGDETITDRRTGLIWQKGGSSRSYERHRAISYVEKLNKKKFARHSDWRMPTIEELASLMEKNKINGCHIDAIFDNRQKRCWGLDEADEMEELSAPGVSEGRAWIVDFEKGQLMRANWHNAHATEWFRTYLYRKENYVRAVRSIH